MQDSIKEPNNYKPRISNYNYIIVRGAPKTKININ